MTMMTKMLAGGLGLAAMAAAGPAMAQYPYGYYPPANPYAYPQNSYPQYSNVYGYNSRYGSPYGRNPQQMAVSQCSAAVQARLNNRVGLQSILGAVLGTSTQARVLTVSSVTPNSTRMRVRGLASSGRQAYNPYGYGYYGALGYNYANAADLSFKCDVDYRGRVRDIDFNRRR